MENMGVSVAEIRKKELPPFVSDAISEGHGPPETSITKIDNTGHFYFSPQGLAFLRQVMWEAGDGYVGSGDDDQQKASAELQRMAQIYGADGLLEFLNELAGLNFKPQDEIDNTYVDFHREFPFETVGGGHAGGGSTFSGSSNRFTGNFDPSSLRSASLDRTQKRTELASAIVEVSGHYAPQANMDPRVMARVLGAVGVIESRFGEARQVVSSRFKSSASGSMHFIDSTGLGEYRQNINDNYIMTQLVQRVGPVDPQTKAGIMRIKDCDHVAVSWVAKRILEVVQRNPDIKDNPEAIFMELYQRHNMGVGAYAIFKKGGLKALLSASPVTAENNPVFFRGADSTEGVNDRYMAYGRRAMNASARLIDEAFAKKNGVDVTATVKPEEALGHEGPKPKTAPAQPVAVPAVANGARGGQPAQTPPTAAAEKPTDKPEVAAAAQGITVAHPVQKVAALGTAAANNPELKPQVA